MTVMKKYIYKLKSIQFNGFVYIHLTLDLQNKITCKAARSRPQKIAVSQSTF